MSCTNSAGTPVARASPPTPSHAHVERRYLLVPGISSSRISILDTKPDPRQPKLVKVIETETIAKRAGYSAPHTLHCGPDGVYISALGAPNGDGPGGSLSSITTTWTSAGPGRSSMQVTHCHQPRHADFGQTFPGVSNFSSMLQDLGLANLSLETEPHLPFSLPSLAT